VTGLRYNVPLSTQVFTGDELHPTSGTRTEDSVEGREEQKGCGGSAALLSSFQQVAESEVQPEGELQLP